VGGRSIIGGDNRIAGAILIFRRIYAKRRHRLAIRYQEIAPWYDHVEDFIGVSGQAEGLAHLPMANFCRQWN